MSGRATSPRLWAGLAVAILVSAAPPAQARPGSVSDIDQAVTFQINLTHTGQQTGDTLVPPLTKMWSLAFTGAVSYPLIAEGKAFVTVANSGNYGTSGTELWSKDISGTYYWSNASYDAGKLFVVNFDGLLQAFDAPTGNFLWSVQLPGQYAFSSPPTATQGIVYTGGAGSGGTVYAVNESNGAVLWTASVENGDHSSPAVTRQAVYVSYSCPQAYAFRRLSGTLIWHYSGSCEGGGGKTPVVYRGRVYVRDEYFGQTNADILDARTGDWVGGFNADRPPAFVGNVGLYMSAGTLTANDLGTGQILWSFAGDGTLASAPIVVNGYVYVGATSGKLYALNGRGHIAWSTNVGSSILAPDEQNVSQPLTGLGVGGGLLVVPAGTALVAYGD